MFNLLLLPVSIFILFSQEGEVLGLVEAHDSIVLADAKIIFSYDDRVHLALLRQVNLMAWSNYLQLLRVHVPEYAFIFDEILRTCTGPVENVPPDNGAVFSTCDDTVLPLAPNDNTFVHLVDGLLSQKLSEGVATLHVFGAASLDS